MTAIVYRQLPNRPRQWLRRQATPELPLWCDDRNDAQRMSERQATTTAAYLLKRSIGQRGHPASQPAGEYGTEAWTA